VKALLFSGGFTFQGVGVRIGDVGAWHFHPNASFIRTEDEIESRLVP
jgi:hypothetical protein